MLGAHSSHSYQTGTNLYFVYDYNINCAPREEITKYHIPLNAIIVEEALSHGGSMVHHHGIGKYRTDWTEAGARERLLLVDGSQGEVRPEGHHEQGHHLQGRLMSVPDGHRQRLAEHEGDGVRRARYRRLRGESSRCDRS